MCSHGETRESLILLICVIPLEFSARFIHQEKHLLFKEWFCKMREIFTRHTTMLEDICLKQYARWSSQD